MAKGGWFKPGVWRMMVSPALCGVLPADRHLNMLIWSEQFATGSPTIDEQHRQLIKHVNRFDAMLNKTNPTRSDIEFIIQFLDFLDDYMESHFSYEEQCMENFHCPMHQKNQQAHENFKQMFRRYKEDTAREGFRMAPLVYLSETMRVWIQDHILRIDTGLKPCLKARRR